MKTKIKMILIENDIYIKKIIYKLTIKFIFIITIPQFFFYFISTNETKEKRN